MPSVAQGRRGSLMAACSVHPARIDINLTPATSPQGVAQYSIPLIQDTSRLHAELLRIIDVIGQSAVLDSVVRVAFNLQFLAPKPSSAEANRALTTVIPSQYGVRVTDEEDFIFQINRPYISREVGSTKMNFITKWSVDRLQILTFSLPAGGATTSAQTSPSARAETKQFIVANVNLDINNVPTENPLAGRQQSSLLREALTAGSQMQQDIGLNIEGFHNVKLST
jgi:hypothetical protein